jgi:branched-chain amino acid transport system permease protein
VINRVALREGPARWLGLVVIYLAGALWLAHSSLYIQGLVQVAAIFAVAALSLDLVIGVTGMFSLGHAGLLGLGAYLTTVVWTQQGVNGMNIFLLLPLAIASSAACGLVIGISSRRVGGLQFAIITFIFTMILTTIVSNLSITGGANGLLGPTSPEWPTRLNRLGSTTSWIIMLVLLAGITVTWSVRRSPLYPVLLAIRDADRFAEAAGARVAAMRIAVFTLSGALVGMAGWAFSLLGAVSPDQFTWTQSVNILIMVLLGGFNTALGPIVGAAIVTMVPAAVGLQSNVDNVIFGAVMVAVVILFPKGIVGSTGLLLRRFARRADGVTVGAVPVRAQAPALDDLYTSKPGRPALVAVPDRGFAVECRGVSFRYPGSAVRAVSGVTLKVAAGTIHGLIGPNGSGKSTLIDVISGRRRAESGEVVINGSVVDGRAFDRARLGFMRTFQAATLVSEMSGLSNVVVGSYSRLSGIALRAPLWGVLPGTRRDFASLQSEASVALRAVGVSEADAKSPIADVPQAVRQLVQLAAVCVARPSTLVLDEPLAGLSVGEIEHVKAVLRELKELGVTVIIVEHQTHFVFEICDHVTVLNSGELVVSGDAATVRHNDRVREVYLGLPAELTDAKG